jgi:signal transduction histidine kinase
MAAVTWGSAENLTTAFGWAVDSQSRAASRRDELFESQQAIKRANALLEATNTRLAEAQAIAEEANQTKTKFITNLSHELRTPLNAIINFSYILAHAPGDNANFVSLTESQRNYLARIQGAGEHLLSIVNDLLDLAKIEAGQMNLLAEEVDLEQICRSALQLVEGLVEEKPVELQSEIPDDLPNVIADSTRLRQILFNLLSNAAKYTNSGHIALRVTCQETETLIAIEDTGIGIKHEEFENIFKEFHQTAEALLHKRVGTGLGLPISKRFIEMHGGKIWLESEVNVGSTFYFTLPLVISEPESSAEIDVKEIASA